MALEFTINNHRASDYTFFYKLTSASNYPVSFKVYNTDSTVISSFVELRGNNQLLYGPTLTDPTSSFLNLTLNTQTTGLCSFNVRISSSDQIFLSSLSLSARIVPYFLSANFIGYPGSYFPAGRTLVQLTPANYAVNSPGMFFYGEGHTDNIFLSALVLDNRATTYVWRISGSTTMFPVSAASLSQPLLTSFVRLTSDLGTDLRLPVSLHVTNSLFLTTDPIFYRDDITGSSVYYPYYTSTTDLSSNELTTNTRLKQSILVKPYDPIESEFNPGIESVVYLPINGSQVPYTATFRSAVSGLGALSACYDKYGFVWNWLNYTNCSASPTTFANKASSWLTTSCLSGGRFPKTWQNEGPLSADILSPTPIFCTGSNFFWNLSTENWSYTEIDPATASPSFAYFLSLEDFGLNDFTTNFFEDTLVTLNLQQTVTCQISAFSLPAGYTNDWKPRITLFNFTHEVTSIAPPDLRIYTSNRFVLTGTEIKFENLSNNLNLVNRLEVDFDDGITQTLLGSNINTQYLTVSYDIVGFKTLKLRAFVDYDTAPIDIEFPNIVQVLQQYDQVSPTEYRTLLTPIQLPWSDRPQVGSNDWTIEDNINSNIKKFYDNLNYLESRGRSYPGTYSDYFGYLGVEPTIVGNVSACPKWTWEDVDCLNTSLPYTVTWRDVLSAEFLPDSGKFTQLGVDCGTWANFECGSENNPTCFGKHEQIWNWKQQKKGNSLNPVTWYQTRCEGLSGVTPYPKKWRYEPSASLFSVVCDEGNWQVNIPKLDTFYDPIANPAVQSRCIYYGVVSRSNKIFTVQKNEIKVFNATRNANLESILLTLEGTVGTGTNFSSLKNICLDSQGKIYILDNLLSQVAAYTYDRESPGEDWLLFTNWGGYGTAASPNKFSNPNDLHIDQMDNVWVCDTGNSCIKHYSNTGSWIKTITDDVLDIYPPLSLAVDSQKNVHVLTTNSIRVYSYEGVFKQEYIYTDYITSTEPRKINSSYNREILYVAFDTQVIKFFRTGQFAGYIVKEKSSVNNITSIYHDEFRNLLITTDDKILKFGDIMTLTKQKGDLPTNYWSLQDLYIHKEEYVQNWVYTKAFQRLWDNIEIFRGTLHYSTGSCKSYKQPKHGKEKMIIGQNEIVTSTVVNRVLGYLWDNFYTLVDYFDPNCEN